MSQDFTITVITGATSSGKTALAIELAKKIDAEIICADSRSVYKNLDIVSAKPKKEEMQGVRHHLLDILEPTLEFSAGDFVNYAQEALDDIKSRGKNVIIAGGTWFYIKSFLDDEHLPKIGINKELREELNKYNPDELWEKLNTLDPKRASVVHKNNKDKVIRSIEMCIGLNMPISEYKRERKTQNIKANWFMPKIQREELYERINKRVDLMLEMGLYEEWRKNKNLYPNSKILENTIGYKEFFELKNGIWQDFGQAVEKIKQRTRNFAKRQLTYFRSNPDIVSISDIDEI